MKNDHTTNVCVIMYDHDYRYINLDLNSCSHQSNYFDVYFLLLLLFIYYF